MKKKLIFPVAATAALLFTSAGSLNADAATLNPKVEKQVNVYQCSNADQINSLLQKYMKDFQINWNTTNKTTVPQKTTGTTQNNTVHKPATKPAPVQPEQKPTTSTQPKQTTTTSAVSAYEQKVVDLTNQERAKQGLPALKLDTELSKVARTKSQDMLNKGYFSHTSPTYGSPFDMMKQFGITYRSAGENIAKGQKTPEEVVNAWMNSEGHRANILNSSYTHIGVGYVANGNYWTQMFIGK